MIGRETAVAEMLTANVAGHFPVGRISTNFTISDMLDVYYASVCVALNVCPFVGPQLMSF